MSVMLMIVLLLSACSSDSSRTVSQSQEEYEAVQAAQDFVRKAYAPDAKFQDAGLIVEPTDIS